MTIRCLCILLVAASIAQAEKLGEFWGTAEAESRYYKVVKIPIPQNLRIEAGCFEVMPDGRLAVGTRRGKIYFISGASDEHPQPRFFCPIFFPTKTGGLMRLSGVH